MGKNIISKLVEVINFSLKVDANSTSTIVVFQPKIPERLKAFKNDK